MLVVFSTLLVSPRCYCFGLKAAGIPSDVETYRFSRYSSTLRDRECEAILLCQHQSSPIHSIRISSPSNRWEAPLLHTYSLGMAGCSKQTCRPQAMLVPWLSFQHWWLVRRCRYREYYPSMVSWTIRVISGGPNFRETAFMLHRTWNLERWIQNPLPCQW